MKPTKEVLWASKPNNRPLDVALQIPDQLGNDYEGQPKLKAQSNGESEVSGVKL